MDTSKFRFSASSVKTFEQCGTKFKFEKVDKLKGDVEVGHARWLGKVVHASVYQSVGRLDSDSGFKSWELISQEPFEHAALTLFESLWVGGTDERTRKIYELEVGSERPVGRFMKKSKVPALNTSDQVALEAAWKLEARQMVKNGVKALTDKAKKIIQLERGVEFTFLEKNFAGYLDIIAEDENGKIIFLDLKTVWDKPSPAKLQADPQFVLYSHALKQTLGLDYYPDGYFIHMKSGASVPFTMTPEVLAKMEKSIGNSFSDMEDNVYRHKPSILCNYCDFQNICPR